MRNLCLLLLTVLAAGAARPAWCQIGMLAGAPAGFEELAAPRLVMLSVSYGGESLGLFAAHVTPGAVRFDDPASLAAHLPPSTDPIKIAAALGQTLPANPDLLCTVRRTEDCGRLVPDIVGLIFDDAHQSAELFINSRYLPVTSQNAPRYLPLPDRHPSAVYNFNGAVSGGTKQDSAYAVTNDSIFSMGEAKLTTQSTIANQGLRFDEAAASVERNGWNATGGLFRSHAMTMLTNRDMAGVSFSSSDRTVLDSRKDEGNAIIVYLPRRAFVSIYREGRLYSSRAYDAGNQELDTTDLPEGAYEVTLKIEESDGSMREEKRFFVKSQDLPPPGQTNYYGQAGLIRKDAANDNTLPALTAHPIVTAGAARRLTDNIGAHVSLIGLQDRAGVETGLVMLTPHTQSSATTFVSSKGDLGLQAGFIATTAKLSAAIDARQTWFADAPLPGFGDQPRDTTQGTVTLSYAWSDKATFGLRGSYSRQTGLPATSSAGPYAEWRIWQQGESSLTFDADAARTQGKDQGDALLHFTRRFGQYGVSASGGAIFNAGNSSPTGNARIWRDSSTGPDNDLIVGAGVNADDRARTASADADWRNSVGQLRGSVQESDGTVGRLFAYGGNFEVGGAQLGSELHLGGSQTNQAAAIVEITGDTDAVMTVFVNGLAAGTVATGSRETLYLTPFHTYAIRVAPKQSGLLDYDDNERKVTLYPGNVVKLSWSVKKFYVVAARLVTPQGLPLGNALLQGNRDEVTTDDHGAFQAEVSQSASLTFTAQGNTCHAAPPAGVQPVNGVLVYRTPLVCAP